MIICVDSVSAGMAGSVGPVTICCDTGLNAESISIVGEVYSVVLWGWDFDDWANSLHTRHCEDLVLILNEGKYQILHIGYLTRVYNAHLHSVGCV